LEGDRKFSVDDFERVLHRDDVDPLVAALLPVARKVAQEDKVGDADVLRLLKSLEGWDLHAGTTNRFPTARGLENTLTPYRGAGLQNVYGAGGGGVAHLARDVGAQFTRDGTTPGNPAVRAYLINWLRSATGVGGRGRGGASDERTARVTPSKAAGRRGADRSVVIPYQRTIPLNLPMVDGSLDIVSGPLACLNQGTLWSQPGNVYTQIVDLSDLDNSRSMIAPGNSEDAASPFRTSQIGLWVQGATHPSPLSREKVEPLAMSGSKVIAGSYEGPMASSQRTVESADPAARFVPAIPTSYAKRR
jgi:penicillin amidase